MVQNNIKLLRKAHFQSQAQFAKEFQIDQTAVSNWENGKNSISLDIAKTIAEKYVVPLEFVYGYEPDGYLLQMSDLRKSYLEDIQNAHSFEERKYLEVRYRVPIYNSKIEDSLKEKPPVQITDGEKALLELFNRVPADKQALVLEMIQAALKSLG